LNCGKKVGSSMSRLPHLLWKCFSCQFSSLTDGVFRHALPSSKCGSGGIAIAGLHFGITCSSPPVLPCPLHKAKALTKILPHKRVRTGTSWTHAWNGLGITVNGCASSTRSEGASISERHVLTVVCELFFACMIRGASQLQHSC